MKLRNLFKKKQKEEVIEESPDIRDFLRTADEYREPTKVMMLDDILNFRKDDDQHSIIDS